MSVAEYQLLNKVLTDKDYGIIEDNYLTQENFGQARDEFDYICSFYEKYKAIPDKETFSSKFPKFDYFTVSQPLQAIVDDLREQVLFQRAVKIINGSTELFEQDANAGVEYLLAHIDKLQPTYDFKCVDIAHDDTRLKEWQKKKENPKGSYIDMPFKEMQEDLFGFQRGEELFLWLAKSSTGKSQILSMCIECASKQGYRVGVISPEMSKESIGYRFDTARTHLSNMAMQKGLLLNGYEEYFSNLLKSDEHIFVADSRDFGSSIITQQCRNFVKAKKLDILFIDGIIYVQPADRVKGRTVAETMGKTCRDLLNISNEFSIPVSGVVQARRRSNEKKSEEDFLSDGESVYNSYEVTQVATRIVSLNKVASALKFLIAKNRYGISGKEYVYNYDYDKLLLTYIPSLDDIVSNDRDDQEVKETKERFKHIF